MLTTAEEDYLKCIYHLSSQQKHAVNTNAIATKLHTKPASVTDMVQKLSAKGLVSYYKYKGASLTNKGTKTAIALVRKHRLWEYFLVNKLHFKWNEVHEIAEQLEHIKSINLVNRLDEYLEFPKYDPHGDPIPDENGTLAPLPISTLNMLAKGDSCKVVHTKDSSTELLNYLDQVEITLGTTVSILDIYEFDSSVKVALANGTTHTLSLKVSENLFVEKIKL